MASFDLRKTISFFRAQGHPIVERSEGIFVIVPETDHSHPDDRAFQFCDAVLWEDVGTRANSLDVTNRMLNAVGQIPDPPLVVFTDVGAPHAPVRKATSVGLKAAVAIAIGRDIYRFWADQKSKGKQVTAEELRSQLMTSLRPRLGETQYRLVRQRIAESADKLNAILNRTFTRRTALKIAAYAAGVAASEMLYPSGRHGALAQGVEVNLWNHGYMIEGRSALNAEQAIGMSPFVRSLKKLDHPPLWVIKMGRDHPEMETFFKNDSKREETIAKYRKKIGALRKFEREPVIYRWNPNKQMYLIDSVYHRDPKTNQFTPKWVRPKDTMKKTGSYGRRLVNGRLGKPTATRTTRKNTFGRINPARPHRFRRK